MYRVSQKKRNIRALCSFCLISPATISLQSYDIFQMKGDIHRYVLSKNSFLSDVGVLRYRQKEQNRIDIFQNLITNKNIHIQVTITFLTKTFSHKPPKQYLKKRFKDRIKKSERFYRGSLPNLIYINTIYINKYFRKIQ